MDSQQKQNPEFGSVKQETQNSNSPKQFDLPSFQCNACSYVSIWKHAVKRHQLTHYRGMNIPPESKRKKYQCEHCSFTGNNWKKLQEHQNLHFSKKVNTSKNKTEEESSSSDEDNQSNQPKHKLLKDTTEIQSLSDKNKDSQSNPAVLDNSIIKSSKSKLENRLRYSGKVEENKFGKDADLFCCTRCGEANDCEEQLEQHMKLHGQKHQVEETTVTNQKKSDLNSDWNKEPILLLNQNCTTKNLQDKRSATQNNKDLTVKTPGTKPVARTRRGKYFDVPVITTKNGLFQCEHCSYQTAIRTALVKHQTNHLKNANS